jgi:GT2 family glycosyltransferase
VVSYNTRELLTRCLGSIGPSTRRTVEVTVVDNASSDGSVDAARATRPDANVIVNAMNRGFAAAVNQAVRDTSGPLVLLLNPDARLPPSGLDVLIDVMEALPSAGCCGPRLVYPDGTFQSCGRNFPSLRTEIQEAVGARYFRGPLRAREPRPVARARVDWLCGACLLLRRTALDDVGPLDEAFFLYGEELDWCARARRAGWEAWAVPGVDVVHHLGASTHAASSSACEQLRRTRLLYHRKHSGTITASAVACLYALQSLRRRAQ